jgi:hypothetical protein
LHNTIFNIQFGRELSTGPPFEGGVRSAGGAEHMGHCIRGYSDVLSLDIVPSESFTRHELSALLGTPLVDGHMEKKPANVQEAM